MSTNAVEVDAFTVAEFCVRNRVGKTKFWELVKHGKGPKFMGGVGRNKKISKEAAAEWRRAREAEAESAASEAA